MGRHDRALEELYRSRYVGFCDALTTVVGDRDAAHDVVQEAFARGLRDVRRLRCRESLAPWIWRIAWNIALRERRRSQPEQLPRELTILDAHGDPALAAAVRSLPPKRRLVIFLRYYAGFTYAEIAEALGISVGTVGATLAQAHAALLEQMAPEEVAPCR
jgi:RNA polymerase sigma factor (sigma-70 family)